MSSNKLVNYLLQIGLASVFLYAAIASFIEPNNWIGYLPVFLRDIFPVKLLLAAFSLYELALAIWLLMGRYTFYASLLSAATLMGIIVLNLGELDIVFRDVAIVFSALALAVATHKKK